MFRKDNGKKLMHFFPTQCVQRHSVTSLETAHSLANSPNLGVGHFSYLSLVYGRSLWAELKGGENFLHWKVNMLPLFIVL